MFFFQVGGGVFFLLFFIFCFFLLNILQMIKVRDFDFFEIASYFILCYVNVFFYENIIYYLFKTEKRLQRIGLLFMDWLLYSCNLIYFFFILLLCIVLIEFIVSISTFYLVFNLGILYSFFGVFFKLFVLVFFFCFFFSLNFLSRFNSFITFEFFGFFLCSFWGLFALLSASDLFALYIFVELQSVCFYILAALLNRSFRTLDAGLKYFIVGSLISSFFLLGLFIIFAYTGLFNFLDLYAFCSCISFDIWIFFALLFIAITFLSKLMVVPFHFWSLDVYDGAAYIVTFFFLVFSKVPFFYMIWLLFGFIFGGFFFYFKYIFLCSAIIAIVYSTFLCFVQFNIKRFFICSSYNHVGFILCAFCCDSFIGLFSFLFYICVYMLMTFLLWLLLNLLFLSKKGSFIYLSDLSGLFISHVYISIIFIVLLFSMAGLPPFLGFFAKFYVIYSLVEASFAGIGGFLLLFSVISAFYYIRLLKFIFIEYSVTQGIFNKMSLNAVFLLCVLSLILVLFVYYAECVFVYVGLLGFFSF